MQEEKRVPNVLCIPCNNMYSENNVTSRLAHVTKPRRELLFHPDVKSRGGFREFYDRFFMNAHFVS